MTGYLESDFNLESTMHFGHRTLFCKCCKKDIPIRHNQIGGFWHLNGWKNKYGRTFWGGYCSKCFDKLHHKKKQ